MSVISSTSHANPPISRTASFAIGPETVVHNSAAHLASRVYERLCMKRILAVLAVFAIVVSACSGSGDVVASVNGEDIVRSQVEILEPQTDDGAEVVDFTRSSLRDHPVGSDSRRPRAELGIEPTSDEIDQRS